MKAATMTNEAKPALRKYVSNMIDFLLDDLPNEPFIQEYKRTYHEAHMKRLEANEDWQKLTEEERKALEPKMNDVGDQVAAFLEGTSDQAIWKMAQRFCMHGSDAVHILYSGERIPDHERLSMIVKTAKLRIVAALHLTSHIMHTNPQFQEQASYAVAFANALGQAGDFPFERLSPYACNRILRYLRAICTLVVPPDQPLEPLEVVQEKPRYLEAGQVEVVSKAGGCPGTST